MKVSIITINFNNAEGLKRTLKSVISQTFRNYEYIVIDGGSNDGSKEVIKEWSSNIDYWVSESDDGIYDAMNKGVRVASGEYVAFLNSGDVYYDVDTLDRVLRQGMKGDICVGDMLNTKGFILRAPCSEELMMSYMMRGSLAHPSSFIRRKLLLQHPYNKDFKICGDREFYIYTLVKLNASYQHLDGIISVFDTEGVSSNSPLPKEDVSLLQRTIEEILPPRVLADYECFMGKRDDYHRLFYVLSFSKKRRWIYRFIVGVLKILTLNRGVIKNFKM